MQVRKRPLNKKEISKKEEDIIDIEQQSNSLTVHETKLKVHSKLAIYIHLHCYDECSLYSLLPTISLYSFINVLGYFCAG